MRRNAFCFAALCGLGLAAGVAAQGGAPAWTDVDPAVRGVLAPWQAGWDALPGDARSRLLDNARVWAAMGPEAQAAYRVRAEAFAALSPDERAQLRGAYADWRGLGQDERAQVAAAERSYLALPDAERAAVRAQFEALDPDARAAWRLGPETGRWFGAVRPIVAFVPPEERAPTLAMLRALPPEAREDLAVLARRLDEADRAALRRELLEAAPDARAALLRARVGR
ncbi:DUF3106 domain-containing protein [Coralloluteibacterium stylophorae]|uniref:DUF3106 domain-containing protein n=1 Tax=Coralloluteibacterium stylophorae TaxID=1776034 RepID=A0A8J7VUE3_9GAMM|nr:DUF3106 domain-containing protein [Coralloluteibacterium stylophorae]MBS7457022.1 DUF3106 domain-containing protein [Coralloluteibacterium stylophorae]